MTDTDTSSDYREEFKRAFLDWARQNPDLESAEEIPEHLEAYKNLLSMAEIRSAISELEPINDTVRHFQSFALAQQIAGGEYQFPQKLVDMMLKVKEEIDAEEDGWELPEHLQEFAERVYKAEAEEDSPDFEP